jgi:hypothetical protein
MLYNTVCMYDEDNKKLDGCLSILRHYNNKNRQCYHTTMHVMGECAHHTADCKQVQGQGPNKQ